MNYKNERHALERGKREDKPGNSHSLLELRLQTTEQRSWEFENGSKSWKLRWHLRRHRHNNQIHGNVSERDRERDFHLSAVWMGMESWVEANCSPVNVGHIRWLFNIQWTCKFARLAQCLTLIFAVSFSRALLDFYRIVSTNRTAAVLTCWCDEWPGVTVKLQFQSPWKETPETQFIFLIFWWPSVL